MHRSVPIVMILSFVLLAAVAAWGGWAFVYGARTDGGWSAVAPVWPFILAGVLSVAAILVAPVRLAFVSQRRGFDDRAGREGP